MNKLLLLLAVFGGFAGRALLANLFPVTLRGNPMINSGLAIVARVGPR